MENPFTLSPPSSAPATSLNSWSSGWCWGWGWDKSFRRIMKAPWAMLLLVCVANISSVVQFLSSISFVSSTAQNLELGLGLGSSQHYTINMSPPLNFQFPISNSQFFILYSHYQLSNVFSPSDVLFHKFEFHPKEWSSNEAQMSWR